MSRRLKSSLGDGGCRDSYLTPQPAEAWEPVVFVAHSVYAACKRGAPRLVGLRGFDDHSGNGGKRDFRQAISHET